MLLALSLIEGIAYVLVQTAKAICPKNIKLIQIKNFCHLQKSRL